MKYEYMNDIIAAVATAAGNGGISIIRVSGHGCIDIVSKIFKGADIKSKESHTITYGHIVSPDSGEVFDEVLVTVMHAPKTYTTEDVVEINCHGGHVSARRVMELLLNFGARLAEPGEFTKRAFLGGRLDLSQAEAVLDVINSKTSLSQSSAVSQLGGSLRTAVGEMREILLNSIAAIEVSIDYPEHDIEEETYASLKEKTLLLLEKTNFLISSAEKGKIVRDGVSMVILGKPNVGKSSLLNCLLEEERAIVTDIPGTTRDAVEEYLNVGGIAVKLIDTAGIRDTDDKVEKIGVEKSRFFAEKSDLALIVLDASRPIEKEDIEIMELTAGKKALVVLNKIDLKNSIDVSEIENRYGSENIVSISAKNGTNIDNIYDRLSEILIGETPKTEAFVTNARHANALHRASESLKKALDAIENFMPVDFVSMDLNDALNCLGEITGDSYDDELFDRIFSQFCLGK